MSGGGLSGQRDKPRFRYTPNLIEQIAYRDT